MAQLAQDACFTVNVILLVIILQLAAVDDLDGHLQGAAHKHYLLSEADTTTRCSLATFLAKQVFPLSLVGASETYGGAPLAFKYENGWDVQKEWTDYGREENISMSNLLMSYPAKHKKGIPSYFSFHFVSFFPPYPRLKTRAVNETSPL